jgi:hypothetical protein
MKKMLKKIHSHYKPGHRMSEMDVIDIFDRICVDKEENFNGLVYNCVVHFVKCNIPAVMQLLIHTVVH